MRARPQPETGWFKQPDGRLRYWNGSSWTVHFADPSSIDVGWYQQTDGWWSYWDGFSWTAPAPTPGQGRAATRRPPRQGSALRLPLLAVASSAVVAVVWLLLADPSGAGPERSTPGTPAPGRAVGPAADVLSRLPVKGRSTLTAYDRASFRFGSDTDGNGCETRDDVLARDLEQRVIQRADTCLTLTGVLTDPYGGRRIDFVRAAGSVDVDHAVSLGNAWVTGAFGWTEEGKVIFGNDPLNLLATDASLNRQKGDGDAATWLPRKANRCEYVARQIAVKSAYALWVTPPERAAMSTVLSRCPGQPLPVSAPARSTPPVGRSDGEPAPTRTEPPPAATGPFDTCAEARAAGAAPVYEGHPGYDDHLDRDGDGVGCDP